MAFTCSTSISRKLTSGRGQRRPRLFQDIDIPSQPAILLLQLPDSLLLGRQRFANAWLSSLLGGILRHPATDGARANAHALADMLNAEALFFNHLDDLQLKARIETAALPCHTNLLEG
jgi:hypothetical protein